MGERVVTDTEIEEFQKQVVPEKYRGKHRWPIEVQAVGTTARLRLIRGKKRIYFDWQVPARYREHLGRSRFLQQVPKASADTSVDEDPGRNPNKAIHWLEEWLEQRVGEALLKVRPNEGNQPDRCQFKLLKARYLKSARFEKLAEREQRTQVRWLAFLEGELEPGFFMDMISPDRLQKAFDAYQGPTEREKEDGTKEQIEPRPGPNTAAKVIRFLKTLCTWGTCERVPDGRYLLQEHPFARIEAEALPRENAPRRNTGVASDEYAAALIEDFRARGESGQALPIAGIALALGRRVGEGRVLKRKHLLTTPAEIAEHLRVMKCRDNLPDRAIPEHEIEEAAKAYAERGFAIRFDAGKQLARNPKYTQHDRVVPLGRKLTAVLEHYRDTHWDPLKLGPEDYLFPSADDRSKPTRKDVVDQWFKRARAGIQAKEGGAAVAPGTWHTFRRRFESTHMREPKKLRAYVGGWTLVESSAQTKYYLAVQWREVAQFIDRIDRTTAAVL